MDDEVRLIDSFVERLAPIMRNDALQGVFKTLQNDKFMREFRMMAETQDAVCESLDAMLEIQRIRAEGEAIPWALVDRCTLEERQVIADITVRSWLGLLFAFGHMNDRRLRTSLLNEALLPPLNPLTLTAFQKDPYVARMTRSGTIAYLDVIAYDGLPREVLKLTKQQLPKGKALPDEMVALLAARDITVEQ